MVFKMATNRVIANYQEIIDISTKSNELTIVGIHTPQGYASRSMLDGFWRQYRKVKYLGCSLSMVPSATLPADLSGVSLDANQPGIDPREPVNPIMFHGAHGESLSTALNVIYQRGGFDFSSASVDFESIDFSDLNLVERMYYAALSDNSFRKFMPQQGVRIRNMYPLVWRKVTNQYLGPTTDYFDDGRVSSVDNVESVGYRSDDVFNGTINSDGSMATNVREVFEFSNGVSRLGFIPTKSFGSDGTVKLNRIPLCYMGVLLLPPSYKTIQYFRLVLNHSFVFSDFTTALAFAEVAAPTGPPIEYNLEYNTASTAAMSAMKIDSLESPNADIYGVTAGVS